MEDSGIKKALWWLKLNWGKLFIFTPLCIILFIIVLFPYSDLKDLITGQIAAATNNQVFVQYDEMGFSLAQGPGIKLRDVKVEAMGLPNIKLDSVSASPDIFSLISGKPDAKISATGLFKGNLVGSSKSETRGNDQVFAIESSADNINLKNVLDFVKDAQFVSASLLPPSLGGLFSHDINLVYDPTGTIAPEGEFRATISKMAVEAFTLGIKNGPMNIDFDIPALQFSNVKLLANMKEGNTKIQEFRLGEGKDGLKIKVTGDIATPVVKRGARSSLSTGRYDLNIDMEFDSKALDNPDIQSLYNYVDLALSSCKRRTASGVRYSFGLASTSLTRPTTPRCK